MTTTKGTRDFTQGPIFFPMLLFTLPIMATGLLQLLYNTADKVVVGQFAENGTVALGAIGCTGSLTSLILALALGLSMGAGVVVAKRFGAHEERELSRAVHTSFLVGAVVGIFVGAMGAILAPHVLRLMDTPEALHGDATLYMLIICSGMPASVLYNFGASILRSVGNSKVPLIVLALSGLLNVGFNLLFVCALHMSVAGVAIATIISQYASAISVWLVLSRRRDAVRFRISSLRIDRRMLLEIIRIGVPSALQSALFGIANVLLQSSVNGLDNLPTEVNPNAGATVSGNAIGSDMEGYTYVAMNSYYQAVLTFTGQNVGAHKPDRVRKTLFYGLAQVVISGLIVSYGCLLFSDASLFPGGGILSLFLRKGEGAAVLAAARERNSIVLTTYFICGIMEVLTGHLRGRGCSITPMISSLICSCLMRLLWVWFVFPHAPSLPFLFLCYPISWILTNICHLVTSIVLTRNEKRRAAQAVSET